MTLTKKLPIEQRILESRRLVRTPTIESVRICEHHVLHQTKAVIIGLQSLDEQAAGRLVQGKSELPAC